MDDIDIFIPMKYVVQLLAFCQGHIEPLANQSIHLTLIHNTLIVDRYRSPSFYLKGHLSTLHHSRTPNFGYQFQSDFSKWPEGLEDSRSHTRVIKYRLGDLNCLLPAGVDACLRGPSEKVKSALRDDQYLSGRNFGSDIALIPKGAANDSPTVEMKSGVVKKADMPQMWFCRTEMSVRARVLKIGDQALVGNVVPQYGATWYAGWESDNQLALRKLTTLIRKLRQLMIDTNASRFLAVRLHHVPNSPLEVFIATDNEALVPKHLVSKFWKGQANPDSEAPPSSEWDVGPLKHSSEQDESRTQTRDDYNAP